MSQVLLPGIASRQGCIRKLVKYSHMDQARLVFASLSLKHAEAFRSFQSNRGLCIDYLA